MAKQEFNFMHFEALSWKNHFDKTIIKSHYEKKLLVFICPKAFGDYHVFLSIFVSLKTFGGD
jgi:hypothetical protein